MAGYRLNALLWVFGFIAGGGLLLLFNFDLLAAYERWTWISLAVVRSVRCKVGNTRFLGPVQEFWRFLVQFFAEPALDEELIGNATALGQGFNGGEEVCAQAQVNRTGWPSGENDREFLVGSLHFVHIEASIVGIEPFDQFFFGLEFR